MVSTKSKPNCFFLTFAPTLASFKKLTKPYRWQTCQYHYSHFKIYRKAKSSTFTNRPYSITKQVSTVYNGLKNSGPQTTPFRQHRTTLKKNETTDLRHTKSRKTIKCVAKS